MMKLFFLVLLLWVSMASPANRFNLIFAELERVRVPENHFVRSNGNVKRIDIRTQEEFDNIQKLIISAQEEGFKTIDVSIASGLFFYHSQHILLRKQMSKGTTIKIRGNGTKIISHGNSYGGLGFDFRKVYLTSSLGNYDVWSCFYNAQDGVEIINKDAKECRVFNPSLIGHGVLYPNKSFIQLTEWYNSPCYVVTKVDNGWIYFVAEDLGLIKGTKEYNVNADWCVSRIAPQFRLCNIDKREVISGNGQDRLIECTESLFLYVDQCEYRKIELSGISFYGNCLANPFIKLMSTSTELFDIHDCQFHSMHSMCVYAFNTDNMVLRNNLFSDMYDNVVYCFDHGKSPVIKNNVFVNSGLSCRNTFAVTCRGDEGYIVGNTIVNFGYGAISVGHYRGEENNSYMIVEGNIIYHTSGNVGSSLIDGGAIYLYPNATNCIVRYNRINNIVGRDSNRGIYCDNGAYGFSLYGNVITGVTNSYCIDSWRYRKDKINNTNNLIMFNIIDGKYRMEGAESLDNNCIKGPNCVLSTPDGYPHSIVLNNIDVEDDVSLDYETISDLSIIVPRTTRRALRHLPFYRKIKQFVKTK